MNRFLKVTLISGLICLLIGAALVFGGVISGGTKLFHAFVEEGGLSFDGNDLLGFGDDYENETGLNGTFEADKEVSSIHIDNFAIGELVFDVYGGETITVEYKNTLAGFVCRQDGSSLILESYGEEWNVFDMIKSWGQGEGANPYVVIHMPMDYLLSSCLIDMDAGSVTIEQLNCKNIEISVDAGSVEVEDLKTDKATLDVDAGEIVVNGYNGGNVEASCDAGSILLQGTVNGNITADCDMGEIDFNLNGTVEKYNYNMSADMGSVYLNNKECAGGFAAKLNQNHNGDYTITADCNMGEIHINMLE